MMEKLCFTFERAFTSLSAKNTEFLCVRVCEQKRETSSEIHTLLAMGKLAENCVCDSSARVRQIFVHASRLPATLCAAGEVKKLC
jgi:CO dehydrogenase nickel-insertion accessory protein CooC1